MVTRLCHRVIKLIICPTHLRISVADTLIYVDNTRKCLSNPAFLLHFIGNILSHSSGKWHDSLTMAALSFTSGCLEFHLCTIFIH